LSMAAQGAGMLAVPVVFSVLPDVPAFLVVGAFLPALALVGWRKLQAIDASTIVPAEQTALLRAMPIFQNLSPAVVDRLARHMQPREARAGTVIIREGDPGDFFYVIAFGEVDVFKASHLLASLGSGQYFGEIALLRSIPRTATCTARTDVMLYTLDRDHFLETVTGYPQARENVHTLSRQRVAEQEALVGEAGTGTGGTQPKTR
jgi:Cyclic nucleotide-binding domain